MNRTVKDALFGLVGGVVGTFVIIETMSLLAKLDKENAKREQETVPEPPTEKLVRNVSRNVFGVEIEDETKSALGKFVRWGYGTVWGGIYGVLRRRAPAMAARGGLPFGVAFGVFGPAIMLPLMGLTPPPTEFPVTAHVRGLISHYAYAATVEGVCLACEKIEKQLSTQERLTNSELRRVS